MFDSQALKGLPPGPELAVALATCDLSELSDADLLEVARAAQRLAGWAESRQLDAVAAFADQRCPDSEPDQPAGPGREDAVIGGGPGTPQVLEFAADEIAAELGMSCWHAARTMADALDLRHRLPGVRQALVEGRVDGWRARLVATGTRKLPAAACADVEEDLLSRLDRVTSRRVKKLVDAAMVAHGEDVAAEELATAEAAQDVCFGESNHLGNKECWATMAAGDAVRLDGRIEWVVELMLAEARLTGVELRATRGQLRARALGMLADPAVVTALYRRVCALRARATHPDGVDADPVPEPTETELPATVVYVHMRREDMLDEGGAAATMEGTRRVPVTPVPYDAVEEVLGHSHVTIQPVLDLDHMAPGAGYAFTGRNREAVIVKSLTCVFPFCDKPSRFAQTDHNVPAPRGPTSVDNGAPLCERHHRVKTHGRWRLVQPINGIYVWVSPAGQVYVVDDRAAVRVSDAA